MTEENAKVEEEKKTEDQPTVDQPEAEKKEETVVEASTSAEATADRPATEEKKEIPAKFKDLIAEIDKMSVLDLSEFVKVLENHYGVSAAAPQAVMAGGTAPAGETEAVEEKTSFDVVLAGAGAQKIAVIKAVREIKPDLGLKEAKDLVDAAPKELLKGVKKEEADAAKTKLEAAGATVEMK